MEIYKNQITYNDNKAIAHYQNSWNQKGAISFTAYASKCQFQFFSRV